MTKLTRSNIAHDLTISPHNTQIEYSEGDSIVFVFSSEMYRNNFLNRLEDNRNKINESLSNRFGFCVVMDVLADLKLYITIEKRGFLIYWNGERVTCLRDITLNGNKQIMQN